MSVLIFLADANLKFLLDSEAQRREYIINNNLETERPLRHFTDQPTEATISKCGSIVLYSIRMKMEIIKRVLINAFYFTRVNFSSIVNHSRGNALSLRCADWYLFMRSPPTALSVM